MQPLAIRTHRLEIRAWDPEDAPVLHDAIHASLSHLQPWMPWASQAPSPSSCRELIASWESDLLAGGDAVGGIWSDGRVVGGCGLHLRSFPGVLDIGYWVHVDHVGRGYATEVARALTTSALLERDARLVRIIHDGANSRSGAVPRRLGYLLTTVATHPVEAPGEAGWRCEWRMTRDQWQGFT